MKPSIGRIVHYVLAAHNLKSTHQHLVGEHRPAIIVRSWENAATINLQVFTDSLNDGLNPVEWVTSACYSEQHLPGTWHWPEHLD